MFDFLICFALTFVSTSPHADELPISQTVSEEASELRGGLRPKPPMPLPDPQPDPKPSPSPNPEPEMDRRPIIPRPFVPPHPDRVPDGERFHPVRKLFRAGIEAACGMFGFVAIAPKAILFVEVIVLVGMLGFVAAIVFGVIWLVKKV